MSCAASALCLFLTVPWVAQQCVIVVFPDHTYFKNPLFKLKSYSFTDYVEYLIDNHNNKPQHVISKNVAFWQV